MISISEQGYYGRFGGAFIPEMLHPNVEEIRKTYVEMIKDEAFQKQFRHLLRDYVGRPTPLFLAERLSEKYQLMKRSETGLIIRQRSPRCRLRFIKKRRNYSSTRNRSCFCCA